jgi:hypothetical protein
MSGVEWKASPFTPGVWLATVGPLSLRANEHRWRVLGLKDERDGDACDLPSAQTAAVNAARGLLVEALSGLAEPLPRGWQVTAIPEQEGVTETGIVEVKTPNDRHGSFALADHAVTIGCALIAAGVRAREGK